MDAKTEVVELQSAPQASGNGTPGSNGAAPERMELIAYRVSNRPPYKLVKAPVDRKWMDDSRDRFAYRCLPLLIANQNGWLVLNQVPFRASWNGGWDKACMAVESLDGVSEPPALTHFGEGVLTFHMPWLFRTPPGWNLWAHGPANGPKDGLVALEGIIETDWSLATFTMNWKFTARNLWVTFEKDEPICMLTPIRRGALEAFDPQEREITAEPELYKAYMEWSNGREQFLKELKKPGSEAQLSKWERHYFRGITRDGTVAPEHQTRIVLKDFEPPPKA